MADYIILDLSTNKYGEIIIDGNKQDLIKRMISENIQIFEIGPYDIMS